MELSTEQLWLLKQNAISAAYQAGTYISKQVNRKLNVGTKASGDSLASQVFTEVDMESQNIVSQVLEPTLEAFDLGFLAEESPDNGSRLQKDYFWCIDPLDGTLPFINQQHGYSVSIALVRKDGVPVVGVVYDPLKQNLYHAYFDGGAFFNHNKIVIPENNDEVLHLYSDRSFAEQKFFPDVVKKFEEQHQSTGCKRVELHTTAGGAMNACMVLQHANACYFKFPKDEEGGGSFWDYAASACIFNEAGAISCDMFGVPLELNRPESTYMNHKGILYASKKRITEVVLETFNSFPI
ncbi:3'(2'),5'-bisphosphate nucleotidase CysQ family protein [Natronoflexus pectinivorans]|uniref:3'(2'), 5'-bisphosphate nucleotidase/myo-inositol-1(Or 4)-monophosphatase n=1 Tax=Natronoflexus pectinivorans TaxID=682526 RepID=A0A4R2GL68_9BACT|nr:inositol monophosphatase family protein [Natronoflexus pectinivorans]TCO08231.1 3'(2'), 5'-bisphosphate nucleotidase/myo-inositol-1(or 4)-monophosphatase [Natronoflexus pectinivorans]